MDRQRRASITSESFTMSCTNKSSTSIEVSFYQELLYLQVLALF